MAKKSTLQFNKLHTAHAKNISDTPWSEYPRPLLKRDSYFSLNGKWEFAVKDSSDEATRFEKRILVPFPPESVLSGIDCVHPEKHVLLYRRTFTLPDGFLKERVLLHFGGVDQVAKVFLNGQPVGSHVGGYIPFSLDITEYLLPKENTVTVEVTDTLSDFLLPYGKQSRNRGGMWYTPVSGIWQSVWLESVPKQYIQSVKAQVKEDEVQVFVESATEGSLEGKVKISTPEGELFASLTDGVAKIKLQNPVKWSPENPYLYYYTVETQEDKIESYFAVRSLSVKNVNGIERLCLNGEPYFFHGLLDQGYWSDGLFTPASPKMYEEEITKLKELGFNTLRKHIKIEPQLFYYECDRLGMIVWQDMINNGEYRYFRDTVLPTLGFIRKKDKGMHKNKAQREAFLSTMKETVTLLDGHPSVCYWTIFNEGWGQFESQMAYDTLKALDDTRIIDSTSGWFHCGNSDVVSRHIYFSKIKIKPEKKPVVLSEFGGCVYSVDEHVFNPFKPYGYGKCRTREEFVYKIRKLYLSKILPAIKTGLCAAIYTQVSDVEDETNGLFTYDRAVLKILPEEFKDVSDMLMQAIKN
ncbi:MAG: glycoside hydrolase family 2 [Clostridia bacterium]|nr:glycoside hydrolase family 2 [Clostridia bacterium]